MIGFQPYETFQLLVETGGVDRANTLLVAACDAYVRRKRPPQAEIAQFEALAKRLFPTAAPSAREKAALTLTKSTALSPVLEELIIANIGDKLVSFLSNAEHVSDDALLRVIADGDITQCAAIASRTDLTRTVLHRLFQMNSRKIYRALAANESIRPTGSIENALARSAQMDIDVAKRLAERKDFDTALLAPTFFDLSEEHRIKLIHAFAARRTPEAPIKRTLEQLSVAIDEFSRALMKLFTENRRPEVTRLLNQVTGLDEVRCGQIAHDTSGAALFVVLRAFGCTAYDGLKVLIHATSHDQDRSKTLSDFAKLFQSVSSDSMAFLLSSWRGDVNLLDLARPEYRRTRPADDISRRDAQEADRVVSKTIEKLEKAGIRQAS